MKIKYKKIRYTRKTIINTNKTEVDDKKVEPSNLKCKIGDKNSEPSDDIIVGGKYKTFGELKKTKQRTISSVIGRLSPSDNKNLLSKWAFEKYYYKKVYNGLNFTDKIENTNSVCYTHIINHCFDSINPLKQCNKYIVMHSKTRQIIKKIHSIDSSLTGVFLDYVVRRLMSEILNISFKDTRCEKILLPHKNKIETNAKIWQFKKIVNIEIGRWILYEKPVINSKKIVCMEHMDKFIELERDKEWIKINFKGKIGWVRYKVPNVDKTLGVEGDIKNYVPNKWFSEGSDHM